MTLKVMGKMDIAAGVLNGQGVEILKDEEY